MDTAMTVFSSLIVIKDRVDGNLFCSPSAVIACKLYFIRSKMFFSYFIPFETLFDLFEPIISLSYVKY